MHRPLTPDGKRPKRDDELSAGEKKSLATQAVEDEKAANNRAAARANTGKVEMGLIHNPGSPLGPR